jgi:Na+/H+ antiporter NhaD/arsenite permease-like protein
MDIAAGLIFLAVLAVLAFDWVQRTKIALLGALVFLLMGIIGLEEAIESVDWATLGLLAGMMIIVGITEKTGVFTYLALRIAQLSRGKPFALMFLLALVTGVASAFLDNLTAILLVVPITLVIADQLRIAAIPLVLTEIFASNIGGTATLIGDPPNILIGTHVEELNFLDFIINLAPVAFFTLFVIIGVLWFMFRKQLVIDESRVAELARMDAARDVRGNPYVTRSVVILVGTVIVFFIHSWIGLEPAVVALGGATILLLVAADNMDEALQRVEWSTMFFFMALFVMVGGLEHQGIVERVADLIADTTGGSDVAEGMAILWGSAFGSALVDNIPFTAAMLPVVDQLQIENETFEDAQWWALALGACFGGNATIVAAAANVAATGILDRVRQPVTFGAFLRAGVPVTVISLVIATVYLLLFQF